MSVPESTNLFMTPPQMTPAAQFVARHSTRDILHALPSNCMHRPFVFFAPPVINRGRCPGPSQAARIVYLLVLVSQLLCCSTFSSDGQTFDKSHAASPCAHNEPYYQPAAVAAFLVCSQPYHPAPILLRPFFMTVAALRKQDALLSHLPRH